MKLAKLSVVLVALVSVVAWAVPAGASPSVLTNTATASVTKNHQDNQKLAWSGPNQTNGPSVTGTNNAMASAQGCEGCTAEAVSFQIIIASDTQTYVLTNNATSTEFQCVTCISVAVAEQWVVGDTSQKLIVTPAGQLALAKLHLQLAEVVGAQSPAQNLQTVLNIADEVSAILAADVVESPCQSQPKSAATPAVAAVTPLAAPAPSGPQVQHYAQVSQ